MGAATTISPPKTPKHMAENEQSLNQKKMALAASEHAPIIIELMKDCMATSPIIGSTQWKTMLMHYFGVQVLC